MSEKVDSFGNSLLGIMLAIAVAVILFYDDPDISDSLRVWIGKKSGTLPADYIYVPETREADG